MEKFIIFLVYFLKSTNYLNQYSRLTIKPAYLSTGQAGRTGRLKQQPYKIKPFNHNLKNPGAE